MATTLVITAHDAETDAPIGLFEHGGNGVHFSAVVVPVKAELPVADSIDAFDSLDGEPANGPLAPEGPSEKLITSTPKFGDVFFPYLTGDPTIYRIGSSRTITLYPVSETYGWYVAALPKETDDYEIEPRFYFVKAEPGQQDLPFTFFSRELTPLAREVLQLREKAKPELHKLAAQWGGESAVVWDMVHNYVENGLWPMVKDERLKEYWINDLSWAVIDFAVPAREFDLLVERKAQIMEVLGEVPWPDLPFFEKCTYGVPVTLAKDGITPYSILNYRICLPTFSAYFPRENHQIKTDLGLLWLTNLGAIFECIIKKVAEKAKEAEKTAKFWKFVSILTPFMLLPTPANVLTGVSELVKFLFFQNVNPALIAALNAGTSVLISLVSGGSAVTGIGISSTIYDTLIKQLKGMLESQGLAELQEVAKDAQKLTALVQGETGLGEVPPALLPFVTWCLRVGILDVLIAQLLSDVLEVEVDPQQNITLPAIQTAQAAGAEITPGLAALVNGEDPNFPAQAPSSFPVVPVVVGGTVLAGGGVLAYLYFTGKL